MYTQINIALSNITKDVDSIQKSRARGTPIQTGQINAYITRARADAENIIEMLENWRKQMVNEDRYGGNPALKTPEVK
jgi:hypothetical protein